MTRTTMFVANRVVNAAAGELVAFELDLRRVDGQFDQMAREDVVGNGISRGG